MWFFHPVLTFWIVEPFDEVEDPSAAPDQRHDFLHIVFLTLLDVVRFSEYLRWVRRCLVFTGLIGFEERNVEDVVNLPFPR